MGKILRSGCLSLQAIFITLILWCAVVEAQQPAPEILNRFIDDKQLEKILEPAMLAAEKYCSDEYIDQLINKEHYQRMLQENFNDQLLVRLPLIPHIELGIYAKDLMKGGLLAGDWIIEWLLYKWFHSYVVELMLNHVVQHCDDYLDLLQSVSDGKIAADQLAGKMQEVGPYSAQSTIRKALPLFDTKLISMAMMAVVVSQSMLWSKKSLFLVEEPNLTAFFKMPEASGNKPMSLFSFVERHPVLSMPLYPMRGGIMNSVNIVFKSWGLLPGWSDAWYVTLGTQISFMLLFINRTYTTKFSTGWIKWSTQSTDIFRTLLGAYQKSLSDETMSDQARAHIKDMLKRYIAQGHALSFIEWMSLKVFWYGIWQTAVNCTLALPAWIKIGKSAYQLYKTVNKDSEPDLELEIV